MLITESLDRPAPVPAIIKSGVSDSDIMTLSLSSWPQQQGGGGGEKEVSALDRGPLAARPGDRSAGPYITTFSKVLSSDVRLAAGRRRPQAEQWQKTSTSC